MELHPENLNSNFPMSKVRRSGERRKSKSKDRKRKSKDAGKKNPETETDNEESAGEGDDVEMAPSESEQTMTTEVNPGDKVEVNSSHGRGTGPNNAQDTEQLPFGVKENKGKDQNQTTGNDTRNLEVSKEGLKSGPDDEGEHLETAKKETLIRDFRNESTVSEAPVTLPRSMMTSSKLKDGTMDSTMMSRILNIGTAIGQAENTSFLSTPSWEKTGVFANIHFIDEDGNEETEPLKHKLLGSDEKTFVAAIEQFSGMNMERVHHYALNGELEHSFYKEKKLIDILVHIGNRSFAAHRLVLCSHSNFFCNLLLNNDIPPYTITDVTVKGLDPDLFKRFVHFAYTGSLYVTPENLSQMQFLARHLQSDSLKSKIGVYVSKFNLMPLSRAVEVIQGKTRYLDDLPIAMEVIKANFKDLLNYHDCLQSISYDDFEELISKDDLLVDSELDVFWAVLFWVASSPKDRLRHLDALMAHVRFTCMTSLELMDCARASEMIQLSKPCRDMLLHANWVCHVREIGLEDPLHLADHAPRITLLEHGAKPPTVYDFDVRYLRYKKLMGSLDDSVQMAPFLASQLTRVSFLDQLPPQANSTNGMGLSSNTLRAISSTPTGGQDAKTNEAPSDKVEENTKVDVKPPEGQEQGMGVEVLPEQKDSSVHEESGPEEQSKENKKRSKSKKDRQKKPGSIEEHASDIEGVTGDGTEEEGSATPKRASSKSKRSKKGKSRGESQDSIRQSGEIPQDTDTETNENDPTEKKRRKRKGKPGSIGDRREVRDTNQSAEFTPDQSNNYEYDEEHDFVSQWEESFVLGTSSVQTESHENKAVVNLNESAVLNTSLVGNSFARDDTDVQSVKKGVLFDWILAPGSRNRPINDRSHDSSSDGLRGNTEKTRVRRDAEVWSKSDTFCDISSSCDFLGMQSPCNATAEVDLHTTAKNSKENLERESNHGLCENLVFCEKRNDLSLSVSEFKEKYRNQIVRASSFECDRRYSILTDTNQRHDGPDNEHVSTGNGDCNSGVFVNPKEENRKQALQTKIEVHGTYLQTEGILISNTEVSEGTTAIRQFPVEKESSHYIRQSLNLFLQHNSRNDTGLKSRPASFDDSAVWEVKSHLSGSHQKRTIESQHDALALWEGKVNESTESLLLTQSILLPIPHRKKHLTRQHNVDPGFDFSPHSI